MRKLFNKQKKLDNLQIRYDSDKQRKKFINNIHRKNMLRNILDIALILLVIMAIAMLYWR